MNDICNRLNRSLGYGGSKAVGSSHSWPFIFSNSSSCKLHSPNHLAGFFTWPLETLRNQVAKGALLSCYCTLDGSFAAWMSGYWVRLSNGDVSVRFEWKTPPNLHLSAYADNTKVLWTRCLSKQGRVSQMLVSLLHHQFLSDQLGDRLINNNVFQNRVEFPGWVYPQAGRRETSWQFCRT